MMMMTEVSFNTTIWQIFSTHILNFLEHEKVIAGKKNRENVRGSFLLFFFTVRYDTAAVMMVFDRNKKQNF